MLKIIKNPDEEMFKEVQAAVKANDGYCPCRTIRDQNSKCPCFYFRSQTTAGECDCGLLMKVEVSDNE